MPAADNKLAARRLIEESWNEGNLAVLDEMCDPAYVLDGGGSVADLKAAIAEYRRGFPDLHMTVEELVAEGDTVVVRWTCRGTQTGEYDGIAPTGKALTSTGISIFHFANGKVVDDRFESNITDMGRYLLDA